MHGKRIFICAMAILGLSTPVSYAGPMFYSLDKSFHPDPVRLVQFDADVSNSTVQEVVEIPGLPSDAVSFVLDMSASGRLFIAPTDLSNTVYEIDPQSGSVLNFVAIPVTGSAHINGLAVSDEGTIYISQETSGGKFWSLDFDTGQATNFVDVGFDVDNIDFDSDGNLIGNDINQTGRLFRIPVDGSPLETIATLDISDTPEMAFSENDSAMYLKHTSVNNNGRGLWRLPWANGMPAGDFEYVKEIGLGHYAGLTAVPEPSTAVFIGLAGLILIGSRTERRATK